MKDNFMCYDYVINDMCWVNDTNLALPYQVPLIRKLTIWSKKGMKRFVAKDCCKHPMRYKSKKMLVRCTALFM